MAQPITLHNVVEYVDDACYVRRVEVETGPDASDWYETPAAEDAAAHAEDVAAHNEWIERVHPARLILAEYTGSPNIDLDSEWDMIPGLYEEAARKCLPEGSDYDSIAAEYLRWSTIRN